MTSFPCASLFNSKIIETNKKGEKKGLRLKIQIEKVSEQKLVIFQLITGQLIEELSCDWLNDQQSIISNFHSGTF